MTWDEYDEAVTKIIVEEIKNLTKAYYQHLQEQTEALKERELTLHEAAEASGFSYSTLQRKVASGEIPNAGEKGAPRIKRKHLPRKAGVLT